MTENPAAFKHKIDLAVVHAISAAMRGPHPGFDDAGFVRAGAEGLLELELKDRVRHLIAALRPCLPDDPTAAVDIVRRAGLGLYEGAQPVAGWANWPLIDFVGEFGVPCFDDGLEALRQMTGLWSAEFAIRPFFRADTERALATVRRWLDDPDEHVRRLVSEGSRPRLPWGGRLRMFQAEPAPVVQLLEALRDDPAEYVRRSVANNLNDIAKDHPELVCQVCAHWLDGAPEPRQRLVQHALRSLVKAGNPAALEALGYRPNPPVEVESLRLSPTSVAEGESVEIAFTLVSRSQVGEPLVVDYAVHHVKANGGRTAKVFKLKNTRLDAGQSAAVRKKHSLKKVTTRVYYGGRHTVEILVNGTPRARADFDLRV